jgi:ABC-type glycerol-3-phosphate transport system permease component
MNTLDAWCALNSAAGGPLLALVTIGGALAAGKSIIAFPKQFSKGQVAERNQKNTARTWVGVFAFLTVVFLLIDIGAYLCAFSTVRQGDKVCPATISDTGWVSVLIFFGCTIVTAIIGSVYAFKLSKLKELVDE